MTSIVYIWIMTTLAGHVVCQDPDARLIPGPDEGRLEVFYDGAWGTLCYPSFTNEAASVVCRSLGKPERNAYQPRRAYGAGPLFPRISEVACSGREMKLSDCALTTAPNTSNPCDLISLAAIVCTDDAPTVQCQPTYTVANGSNVIITCTIDANPLPHTYNWTDSSGNIVASGDQPSLVISSVGPQNAGRYKIMTVNRMQLSNLKIASGIGISETEIIIGQPDGVTVSGQPDDAIRCQHVTGETQMSAVTYTMIGVGVASLIVNLLLVVIMIKIRTNKGVSANNPIRDQTNSTNSAVSMRNNSDSAFPSARTSADSSYIVAIDLIMNEGQGDTYDTIS